MKNDRPIPADAGKELTLIVQLLNIENLRILQSYFSMLKAEYFTDPLARKVFNSMRDMTDRGIVPDIINVVDTLNTQDEKQKLMELNGGFCTTAFLENRALEVKNLALRRIFILKNAELIENIYATEDTVAINDYLDEMGRMVSEIKAVRNFTTGDTIREIIDLVHKARMKDDAFLVQYRIPEIDRHIKHLRRQMHVLAAMSGVGKTAFGLSCMAAQIRAGMKIAYFCGESTRHEIMLRLNSIYSKLSFETLISGLKNITTAEMRAFQNANEVLNSKRDNFRIYGKGDYNHGVADIGRICSDMAAETGLDMVWIDYLQNMNSAKRNLDRFERVEDNVFAISNMTGEINAAVVLLSQLNREAGSRTRPRMNRLKYSSTIENEAHIISFLHRADENVSGRKIIETEWYTDKTRVVKPFMCRLAFNAENAEFTGLSREQAEEKFKPYKER